MSVDATREIGLDPRIFRSQNSFFFFFIGLFRWGESRKQREQEVTEFLSACVRVRGARRLFAVGPACTQQTNDTHRPRLIYPEHRYPCSDKQGGSGSVFFFLFFSPPFLPYTWPGGVLFFVRRFILFSFAGRTTNIIILLSPLMCTIHTCIVIPS